MPGPNLSTRPYRDTDNLINTAASARWLYRLRAAQAVSMAYKMAKPLKRFGRMPELQHRAKATVLIRLF
jgi:hypothetical protein